MGVTFGCKANEDKGWYRGVLWYGDRKVLGFPPTATAHFYLDGDVAAAKRLARAFVNAAQEIATSGAIGAKPSA